MTNKLVLRQLYLTNRNSFSKSYQDQASQNITQKILDLPITSESKNICVFVSIKNEVNTHSLINQLLASKKVLWAPVIQNQTIKLRQLTSIDTCVKGQLNILEPPTNNPKIDPNQIDLFIVPGLCFDTFGYRLGYGKGYYDRLLSNTHGFHLGIGFTDQLTHKLPHDEHDVRMHRVISDTISFNTLVFKKK